MHWIDRLRQWRRINVDINLLRDLIFVFTIPFIFGMTIFDGFLPGTKSSDYYTPMATESYNVKKFKVKN